MITKELKKTKIKDYSEQDYQNIDEKDFKVRTIRENRLITPVPGLDDEIEFAESMYNYGEADNLPDSDKAMECEPHQHCVHKGKSKTFTHNGTW